MTATPVTKGFHLNLMTCTDRLSTPIEPLVSLPTSWMASQRMFNLFHCDSSPPLWLSTTREGARE